jgi:SAM-dependent methyltransferase
VPPEILFRDYVYFSSFSDTMTAHALELCERFVTSRRLGPHSLALEIASNDGYLLQHYKKVGIPVLGIEPAENIARIAVEQRGVRTLPEFFGLELARRLRSEGMEADVVHANNVLAHVADLNGFVAGIREILKPEGMAALEFPYLGDMVEHCEFDTIYHEHLCYFSLTAIANLFGRHGLKVIDVQKVPIHGGSLLLQAARAESRDTPTAAVGALLAEERRQGIATFAYYEGFSRRVLKLKEDLRALLARLKTEGRSIAAYGAAAKGSTLLNTFGIGAETLDFVADRSTYKQGRYMPGVRIPIVAPERLRDAQPDYTLLLTWNFAEEILRQQDAYRRAGGRFIIPVPDARVV